METSREQADSILAPVAHLVAKINLEHIPDAIVNQAELSVVDILGCIVRGYCTDEGKKAIAVEKSLGGQPESTILVSGERVSAISAARANGYLGDIMEFNDLIAGHAGIATVPTAIAVAEWQRASGAAFLTAVVLGYEVTSRIQLSFYQWKRPLTECCSLAVGGPNTLAAAAITAKLMGLDEPRILEAMLIAGSLLAYCPAEPLEAGASAKAYMFGGWPASVGIYAAICAREGITGARTILDGKLGLFSTWAHGFDLRLLTESLGENWILEKPWRKAHAACGFVHSSLDGILSIVHKHNLRHTDIAQVEVRVPPLVIPLVGGPVPANALAAKFSFKYLLAVAAMTGRNIQPEDTEEDLFHRYLEEGASALMDRITIYPEESFDSRSHSIVRRSMVSVLTKGGQHYTEHLEHPKGTPENPLIEEEVLDKFRAQVSVLFSSKDAERVLAAVFALRNAPDLSEVVSLLTR